MAKKNTVKDLFMAPPIERQAVAAYYASVQEEPKAVTALIIDHISGGGGCIRVLARPEGDISVLYELMGNGAHVLFAYIGGKHYGVAGQMIVELERFPFSPVGLM